jgi:hypothetical protein
MRTHSQIVTAAGESQLAEIGGVPLNTVISWRQRDRIPADLWKPIADAQLATLDELAGYAAANPRTRPTQVAA